MSAIPTSSPSTQLSDRSWNTKQSGAKGPSPTWALFLKECRQIFALFASLLLIAAVVHFVGYVNGTIQSQNSNSHRIFHQVVFALMPALFAIGVGGLLVSQEKELRTLLWLTSLPIPIKKIVQVKLLVGVMGLTLFWLISSIIAFAFSPNLIGGYRSVDFFLNGSHAALQYVLSSYFLLITSMVCGWIFESTWMALVAIIPVAIASCLVNIALADTTRFFFPATVDSLPAEILLATVGALFNIAVISAIGIYWGRRSFVASPSSFGARSIGMPSYSPFRGGNSKNWKTDTLFTSLIWQAGFQNPMLWIAGLGSIFLVGMCYGGNPNYLGPSGFIVAILLSWLGASTFGTDGIKGRIRFLADRGISPGVIWTTRMVLPGIILSLATIGVAYTLRFTPLTGIEGPTMLIICTFGLLVFSVTQWSSMWMRSTLISMCLAPALTVAMAAYPSFVTLGFGASPMLMLGTALTMLLASRIMTRPWMDGRTGWKVVFQHLGFGVIALVIPALPTLWVLITYPQMSRAASKQLAEIVGHNQATRPLSAYRTILLKTVEQVTQKELTASGTRVDETGGSVESTMNSSQPPSVDWSKMSSQLLAGIEHQFDDSPYGLSEVSVRDFVQGEATLTGLSLKQLSSQAVSDTESQQSRIRDLEDRYRRSIQLLHKLILRDRRSGSLRENEFADRNERWLVHELQEPSSRGRLGDAEYREIVKTLADTKGREDARRYAIATAWWELQNINKKGPKIINSFEVRQKGPRGLLPNYLISKRRGEVALEALLNLLNTGERNPSSAVVKQYEQTWAVDGLTSIEPVTPNYVVSVPGLLWFKDWEADGRRLLDTIVE